MLKVSKMTIYRLIKLKQLPAFQVGRSLRIPTMAVWKYLDESRTRPAPPIRGPKPIRPLPTIRGEGVPMTRSDTGR